MGIPTTIKSLSSFRSSFQLHETKNRIKTKTEKPKRMQLNFNQNSFTRTLKEVYDSETIKKSNDNKATNHRCYGMGFKQQSQKIIIKLRIFVMCCYKYYCIFKGIMLNVLLKDKL